MRITQLYFIVASILSLIIWGLSFMYVPLYKLVGFEKALEGVLLLSSISLGFYGACLSVLASIFNTKLVKEIMNDKEYRKDFILIACLSLGIGFLTVICTIVYQVIMENKQLTDTVFRVINATWLGLLTMFFSLILIFIFVSFSIFFKNKDSDSDSAPVYTPPNDYSNLDRLRNR